MTYTTRIAPSPTGHFHLGTARTAYFCWLAARSTGGQFVLRIDDTDKSRCSPEYEKTIFDCMEWLGLDYDTVFRQSDRNKAYVSYINTMINANVAYRDNGVIRLTENNIPDNFDDFIGRKMKISEQDKGIAKDMIIFRSDGSPTYHFCSVADDIDFGINLVLRGKDHISNVPRHIAIANAFATIGKHSDIKYGHLGLILKDNKKLSKRDGSSNLANYIEHYTPEAVLNYMLKLGWGHPNPNIDKLMPTISKAEALSIFFDGKMRQSNSKFDQNKLDWLNNKWLARLYT